MMPGALGPPDGWAKFYGKLETRSLSEFIQALSTLNPMAPAAWDRDGIEWTTDGDVTVWANETDWLMNRLATIYGLAGSGGGHPVVIFLDNPPRFLEYRKPYDGAVYHDICFKSE